MFALSQNQRTIVASIIVVLSLVGNMTAAQRAIPDDNLAYPVLIILGNGSTGSGFYLNSGVAIYLVTAKHVLFDPNTHAPLNSAAELLSYSKDIADPTPNVATLDLTVLQNEGNVKPHPSQDVVVVKVAAISKLGPAAEGMQITPLHGATILQNLGWSAQLLIPSRLWAGPHGRRCNGVWIPNLPGTSSASANSRFSTPASPQGDCRRD